MWCPSTRTIDVTRFLAQSSLILINMNLRWYLKLGYKFIFTRVFVSFQNNYLIRFSQQELMDCSWGEGNNACDGGEEFRAYQWVMKNGGLTTEDQYGQYLAQVKYRKPDGRTPGKRVVLHNPNTFYNVWGFWFQQIRLSYIQFGIHYTLKVNILFIGIFCVSFIFCVNSRE